MSKKKQLIVAADVQAVAKAGGKSIALHDPHAIVTAQARSLAQELGVSLQTAPAHEAQAEPVCDTNPAAQPDPALVRRLIESQTHAPASAEVLAEVLRRVALAHAQPDQASASAELCAGEPMPAQIHKITSLCPSPSPASSAVYMSQLDLTTLGLSLAAPCGCGFMGWSDNAFDFHRTSDEVNLVLEGELQFHVGSTVLCAVAGDVLWIPKGTQGKIGTPSEVRYFYLSYPG